jgi:site-specific recombinase XerD
LGITLRKRRLPSGHTQLYFDIHTGGRRWTEGLRLTLVGDRFLDQQTMKMAKATLLQRQLEMSEGRLGVHSGRRRSESFISYLESLGKTRDSENTRASWEIASKRFSSFAGEHVTFADLTRELLERYKAHLLEELSPNSAQIYFSRVKTALHQAMRDGIISTNPALYVNIRKEAKLPVSLTLEEVRKLSKTHCGNTSVRNAFLFSCFTGLRYSDLVALTRDKIKGGFLEFTQKKTGRPERLPLCEQAIAILEEQRKTTRSERITPHQPQDAVFPLPRQSTIDKVLKKWGEKAELEKPMSMHKARHTFAVMSLSSGIDIYTTSKLLGHKNLATTQIYARVVDEKKRKAVEMLPTIK